MPVETVRRRDRGLRVTRTRSLSAIALLVFLVAAGCGGDDDDSDEAVADTTETPTTEASVDTTTGDDGGPADATGVCGLITPVDIEAALHITVGEGELVDDPAVPVCGFESDDGSTTLRVARYEPVGDLIANTLGADPEPTELPGVGDEAVDQIHIGTVTMRVGEIGVAISANPAPALDVLVQLARISAGRV